MHKPYLYAGCDISADWVDLACGLGPQLLRNAPATHRRFANTAAGHCQLISYLRKSGALIRVVVEASGIYSLDFALALHEADGVEIMLVNPRAAKDYRRAQMHRSKSDELDAAVLCDYALRMPFVVWQPPEEAAIELRQLARRIADLTVERAREKNRLHAAKVSRTSSAVVVNDIEVNLRHLNRRIDELVRQALKVVRRSTRLTSACRHLTSVRGIAAKSAVLLMGELMTLPREMAVREWVSYAGLDVRQHRSGRTVAERPRTREGGQRPHPPSALHARPRGGATGAACRRVLRAPRRAGEAEDGSSRGGDAEAVARDLWHAQT